MTTPTEESLYKRLGGYDAIAAVTDDFLERVMGDPQIGGYWKGDSNDTKRRDRQLVVDFICEAAGGPVYYTGRDMRTSHDGLGISESEWQVLMRHAIASLDRFEVPEKEKGEVLSFLDSLKGDIVEKE